jgi:hypothetical protein
MIRLLFPDMLNHSPNANCFLHWRFKDRMLEVMIKAGRAVKKGDEVLFKEYTVLKFLVCKIIAQAADAPWLQTIF